MGLVRLAYDIVLFLTLLFLVPVWWLVYRRKGYHLGLLERLTINKRDIPKDAVWIHCASIGEIRTALAVIEYIKSKRAVFLTVFSPRAYRYAEDRLDIPVIFLPFDISFLIKRFIRIYRPKALVVEEAEFWFNMIAVSSEFMPVIWINTNMPKQNPLHRMVAKRISKFITKSERDKEILQRIVGREKVESCGNLKLLADVNDRHLEIDLTGRKVIIAGSTHPPEEDIILRVFIKVKQNFPEALLIIAPRHIERLEQIKKIVEEYHLSYSLRSKDKSPKTDVYILDSVGELSSLYKYGDAVFVGGTISKVGGHNIFEPILSGKRVIIGKNYHKIEELVEEAIKLDAITIVENEQQLKDSIEKYLNGSGSLKVDISSLRQEILNCYKKEIDRWIQ